MADLPVSQNWGVEVPDDVRKMWLNVQIQELKSRITRTQQDIEDLMKGKVLTLQANLKMLELSLKDLEAKRDSINIQGE